MNLHLAIVCFRILFLKLFYNVFNPPPPSSAFSNSLLILHKCILLFHQFWKALYFFNLMKTAVHDFMESYPVFFHNEELLYSVEEWGLAQSGKYWKMVFNKKLWNHIFHVVNWQKYRGYCCFRMISDTVNNQSLFIRFVWKLLTDFLHSKARKEVAAYDLIVTYCVQALMIWGVEIRQLASMTVALGFICR